MPHLLIILSAAFESGEQHRGCQAGGRGAGLQGTCDPRRGSPEEAGDRTSHQSSRKHAELATAVTSQRDGPAESPAKPLPVLSSWLKTAEPL